MNHPFWGTTIFGNIQVFQDWFDWFLRPSTTFATGAASSMSNSAGVPGYSALRHDFQGCGKMLEKGMFQFVEGGGMWFFEWFFFGTCLFFLHGFLLLLVSDLEDSCDRNVESSETELHPIEMPLIIGNMLLLQALAGVVASTALLGAGAAVARRTSVLARSAIQIANQVYWRHWRFTMLQGTNLWKRKINENHLLWEGFFFGFLGGYSPSVRSVLELNM